MKFIRILLFTLSAWGASSCANQSQPTGGPKDESPPVLVTAIPSNQSINYSGNSLELVFDEIVKVDQLNKELLITPNFEADYIVRQRKNLVTLIFERNFDDSTTYTFNFRNAIKDVTENNPAQNLVIAFSTGNYLDSLSIEGSISSLLTNKPAGNILVGLYPDNDTLKLMDQKPFYVTRSLKNGSFQFRNLRKDNYRIAAFSDKDDDLFIDPKSESYGFLAETLVLDSFINNVQIPILFLDVSEFKLVSNRQSGKYYELRFNKYITDYRLEHSANDLVISSIPIEKNRIIKIFNTFQTEDSLQVYVTALDSLGSILNDTLFISFEETERLKDPLTVQIEKLEKSNKTILSEISFSKPLKQINLDGIYFQLDSLTRIYPDTIYSEFKDLLLPKIQINMELPDTLTLPPKQAVTFAKATFISIENDTSQNLKAQIKLLDPEKFGIVSVFVETQIDHFIVQLLDKNYNLVKEVQDLHSIRFEYLTPGDYHIRVLFDEDGNGSWDPGNIMENKIPEPVRFFLDPDSRKSGFIIRANWELGPYLISYLDGA